MDKQTPNYKLVFVLLLLGSVLTYWARFKPVRVLFTAPLDKFPKRIGQWQGHDEPIEKSIRDVMNADKLLSRTYVGSDPDYPIGVWIVYRKFGRRDFAHRPEMCYPASGWEITKKCYIKLPYDGREVDAVEVVATRDFDTQVIVYWFASGERTEANFAKQQIIMALDRLRTQKYGWAFIRLNIPVVDTEENALRQIRDFLSAASTPLARVLKGTDASSASAQ
ncbi:MAG: EpsI family protein [Armatimonadota bacterium]|nr:EpsI family protein [Armatimonadota bacterium]